LNGGARREREKLRGTQQKDPPEEGLRATRKAERPKGKGEGGKGLCKYDVAKNVDGGGGGCQEERKKQSPRHENPERKRKRAGLRMSRKGHYSAGITRIRSKGKRGCQKVAASPTEV